MIDLYHYIGNDLSVGATGDLAFCAGTQYGQQRVVRRLITNPLAYIWHIDYGGGLGALIGSPTSAGVVQGIIRGQISKEAAVSQTPTPTVTVYGNSSGLVNATIQYADADTSENQVLTVPQSG
jgi:hypothetical protein